jgi:hypothetical protein
MSISIQPWHGPLKMSVCMTGEIGLVPARDTHEMSLVTDADNRPLTSGDAVTLPANRE